MAELKDYFRKHNSIVAEHGTDDAGRTGQRLAWLFIAIAVLVTGWQTHKLAYAGMQGSVAFAGWEDWAASLTVFLLEGTAVAVTWCTLHYFRSVRQVTIGKFVSAAIWGVLAINMLVAFAMAFNAGKMNGLVRLWAQVMFPLAIVGAAVFWKEVLHRDPLSEQRIAALRMDADQMAGFRDIHRRITEETLAAYRAACEKPEVKQAIAIRTQRAAMEQAAEIIGEIHSMGQPAAPAAPAPKFHANGHAPNPFPEQIDFSPRRR